MASNSASCKTWCITIVSALTVLAIDKNRPEALAVGFLPVGLFFLLDAYYLSLERDFVALHQTFVKKLHDNKAVEIDVYQFKPEGGFPHRLTSVLSAILSLSIIPFYGVLTIALIVTQKKLFG
jgi:hypothetical protein